MQLDRKLNLIIPVTRDGVKSFVHSTPISRAVFETYFMEISKTFARIYKEGLDVVAGPRIAYLLLKRVSTEMGTWDTPGGVKDGLVQEIIRLSNVLAPGASGWTMTPLHDGIQAFTEEERATIENLLVFFTVVSLLHTPGQVRDTLGGLLVLWDAQTTSSSCSEYINFLATLTKDESGGEKAA